MQMTRAARGAVALILLVLGGATQAAEYRLSFTQALSNQPYTGRVYLFFSRSGEPRKGPDWFHPEPFVAREVTNWKPGETLTFSTESADVLRFPRTFDELNLKDYSVQAVARFNPWERDVGQGVGNGFSRVAKVDGQPLTLVIDQRVPPTRFVETKWTKLLVVPSPRLSAFHKRDVASRAAVMLPASYFDQPQRRYPVILAVPGFGGTHFDASGRNQPTQEQNAEGVEFIRLVLDPSCPLGHHAFADSANNGPVGSALVHELLPALDAAYRTDARPEARFLTGHSSGGWSTLWLQVTYPETFGGTWSTAPDPVDFRDFQQINLYAGDNMYRDAQGQRRPLARFGERIALWYDDFDRMEHTCGPGGQLHSFEAVFSPRGDDGRPLRAWDRQTGNVDLAVVKAWEAYDIRLILERNWKDLGPRLAGKLHILMGEADTFYLEGATRKLGETLKALGSDAVVEMVPGKDHFNLLDNAYRERLRKEMTAVYLKHRGAPPKGDAAP